MVRACSNGRQGGSERDDYAETAKGRQETQRGEAATEEVSSHRFHSAARPQPKRFEPQISQRGEAATEEV